MPAALPSRPVNVALSDELVMQARTYTDILSATMEAQLTELVEQQQPAQRTRQHMADLCVSEWNQVAESCGSFADQHINLYWRNLMCITTKECCASPCRLWSHTLTHRCCRTGMQTNGCRTGHVERLLTAGLSNAHKLTRQGLQRCANALPFVPQRPNTLRWKLLI